MDRKIQYLQLDFLQLFRLSRRMGFINRKRRMPSEYDNTDEALTCAKRMMKSCLVKVFPSDIGKIKTTRTDFTIDLDAKYHSLFYYFYSYTWGEKEKELLEKYNVLYTTRDNYILCSLISRGGRQIKISTTHWQSYYYYGYNRSNRLPHRFYETALRVLQFKELWDDVVPQLISLKEQSEKVTHVREKESVKVVKKKSDIRGQSEKNAAQIAFDTALAKYIERTATS